MIQSIQLEPGQVVIQYLSRQGRAANEVRVVQILHAALDDEEFQVLEQLEEAAERALELAKRKLEERAPDPDEPSPYDHPDDIARWAGG